MFRDLVIALSLANLCYLRVWTELLTYRKSETYVLKQAHSSAELLSAGFSVLVLGGLIWLAITLARRDRSGYAMKVARWAFLLSLLVPLNALRGVLASHLVPELNTWLYVVIRRSALVIPVVLLLGWSVVRWQRKAVRAAAAALMILSPFVPLIFLQAIWAAVRYDPAAYANRQLASPLPPQPEDAPRVLWVIFDEWDERLTFPERPAGRALPEFDRFRQESLYADHAYPPAGETQASVPALTMGKLVSDTRQDGPGELQLFLPGASQSVPWSAQKNFFSRAREAGFNTALVGWFHPYCRILNDSLTACWWWQMDVQHNSMGSSFSEIVPNQVRSLFESTFKSPFGQPLATVRHIRTYEAILRRARQVVTDTRYGVVFLHLPIPHAPHFYDASSGQYTLRSSPQKGYFGSLQLADRTLGDLRRTLEQKGLWEKTTILLSSDHSHRSARLLDGKVDHRVPFLFRLRGQQQGLTYNTPFNTLLSGDLLLAVLRNEIASASDAADWLDRHRTIADSPYNHIR